MFGPDSYSKDYRLALTHTDAIERTPGITVSAASYINIAQFPLK